MRCFCTKIRTHHCKVVLLDEQELIQEIQDTSRGQEVLDTVYRHLNLLETSYFGLRYIDTSNQTHWLDTTKKVVKQLKGKETFTLYFGVKFYAADPCKLLEEITRYQFFLQVKQDILQGRLPVPFDLAAELGAYVVQSELGDYDPRRHSPGYVSEFRFLSNQSVELEGKIAEQHKDMQGQLPSVAELNYLDKVKWLEMYGVDLHPVLGEDNVEYFLGLTPTGVIVLRNKNKVANYFWPRITKIYFKGRYFMLRVCDKNNEENTYGFETPSKPACKHLYKCCVEHHAFFRLVQVSPNPPDVIGTRFSSGRAEKISQREAQMRLRSPPQFTRTPSRRYQRRIVEGAQDIPKVDEMPKSNKENIPVHEMKHISVPQPVQSVASLYRGAPVMPSSRGCDSPRSTRSAPWGPMAPPPSRGLYSLGGGAPSPRSVRSQPHSHQRKQARRSSSVESHSSNDSRSCRRHRHRSRRGSDNESELSRCSGKSRRHRHRSRRSSGSEHESRRHSSSKHRYELVESESQWKEVQRKQAEGSSGVHHANVISSSGGGGGGGVGGGGGGGRPRSGYMNSGMETESEHSYHHRRKHRKHRSRSRSPSDKPRLPEELKQHLEFQLVETAGMSESQLREIPYKVVETTSAKAAVKVRLSPTNKRRTHSSRRINSGTLKEEELPSTGDSPPPPYSESPATNQNAPNEVTNSDLTNKNAANNNNSHHQLPRNGTPALTPQSVESSAQNTRSLCSALYGNPTTLLGQSTHHNINRRNDNSNWISQDQTRVVSHHNSQPSNSTGGSLWKQDLPPRNIPFGSMRQSLSNSSNHKPWVGPEVRGTVGLAWKTPDNQFPPNFPALPETSLSRRPSQEGLLNYTSAKPPRPNMNTSSQEYLASSNGGLNYAGISSNLRSSRSSIIDQANGNITYNSPSRQSSFTQSSSFVDLNRSSGGDSLRQVMNGSSDLNGKPRVTSSSSSSLQSTSNLTNTSKSRSNLSVDQNGGPTHQNGGVPTPQNGGMKVNSQSQQQLIASADDLSNGVKWGLDVVGGGGQLQQDQVNKNWGPGVFYQGKAATDNTTSTSAQKNEVNNNPMIVHEMSTEL